MADFAAPQTTQDGERYSKRGVAQAIAAAADSGLTATASGMGSGGGSCSLGIRIGPDPSRGDPGSWFVRRARGEAPRPAAPA